MVGFGLVWVWVEFGFVFGLCFGLCLVWIWFERSGLGFVCDLEVGLGFGLWLGLDFSFCLG